MASCKSCEGPNPAKTCPSRMEDGRAFTDYGGMCSAHARLMNQVNSSINRPVSSYNTRMYLQHNAEKIMQQEYERAVSRLIPCAPCTRPFSDPGTMLPERYVYRCDGVACASAEVNPYGLGDGRAYK